jgi:hypothetical protein
MITTIFPVVGSISALSTSAPAAITALIARVTSTRRKECRPLDIQIFLCMIAQRPSVATPGRHLKPTALREATGPHATLPNHAWIPSPPAPMGS